MFSECSPLEKSCLQNSIKFTMKLCLHMDDISYLFCLISFSFLLWYYFISIRSVIIILFNLLPIITTLHTFTHPKFSSLYQTTNFFFHIYFSHRYLIHEREKNLHQRFFFFFFGVNIFFHNQSQFVFLLVKFFLSLLLKSFKLRHEIFLLAFYKTK